MRHDVRTFTARRSGTAGPRTVGAALVAILALSSCGSSDDTTTDATVHAPSGPTGGTSEPSDRPDDPRIIESIDGAAPGEVRELTARHEIRRTVHYAGFDVAIEQVLIGFDPAGFAVAQVDATLTNGSSSPGRLDTLVVLESAGSTASVDRDNTPEVAAGASASGNWSLRLPPSFDDTAAVLFIGRPDRVRAEIPLNDPDAAVTLEPVVVSDSAGADSELASITLTTVTISTDTAQPRAQSEPGSRFLTIEYELTPTGATALSDDVWSLRLPSGDTIAPSAASNARADAGVPTEGLTVTFVVSEPATGEYTLRYTERFGAGELDVIFDVP